MQGGFDVTYDSHCRTLYERFIVSLCLKNQSFHKPASFQTQASFNFTHTFTQCIMRRWREHLALTRAIMCAFLCIVPWQSKAGCCNLQDSTACTSNLLNFAEPKGPCKQRMHALTKSGFQLAVLATIQLLPVTWCC